MMTLRTDIFISTIDVMNSRLTGLKCPYVRVSCTRAESRLVYHGKTQQNELINNELNI